MQQLLLQQQSQQNAVMGPSALPLPYQINRLLMQKQGQDSITSDTSRRRSTNYQRSGLKPAEGPSTNESDFTLEDASGAKQPEEGQDGKPGRTKKFKRPR
jgi:hypothetical protein